MRSLPSDRAPHCQPHRVTHDRGAHRDTNGGADKGANSTWCDVVTHNGAHCFPPASWQRGMPRRRISRLTVREWLVPRRSGKQAAATKRCIPTQQQWP